MRKILEEKMIGDIVAIESSYNTGAVWHRGDNPDWSRMEYQIRNWYYYTWLSGDLIIEQGSALDRQGRLAAGRHPANQGDGTGGTATENRTEVWPYL